MEGYLARPGEHPSLIIVAARIESDSSSFCDLQSKDDGDEKLKNFVILGFDFQKDVRDHCGAEGADAYTSPVPDFISPKPQTATYFCPKAFDLPTTKNDLRCVKLGDTLSADMDFLGATILHEWM